MTMFLNLMATGPVTYTHNSYKELAKSTQQQQPINFQTANTNETKVELADFAKEGKTTLNNSFMPKASQEEIITHLKKHKSNPAKQAKAIVGTMLSSGHGLGTYEIGIQTAVYAINKKNLSFVEQEIKEQTGVSLSEYIDSELSKGESKDLYRHINQFKK